MKLRVLAPLVLVVGCGMKLPLPGLSGPNVAANGQAGQSNFQTIGPADMNQQSVTRSTVETVRQSRDTNQVNAEKVETVTVHQTPVWLILAFAAALFLDSPLRWPEEIAAAIRKRKKT
jgi:hypothetical protein